jgi:hypothetical protein
MKYMTRTAWYSWTDHKTNTAIANKLNITPVLDKIQDYNRNWIQYVNWMPRNRLHRSIKKYTLKGKRNQGRPLKRLLHVWDWNRSTTEYEINLYPQNLWFTVLIMKIGFQVLTAASIMFRIVFWDVLPCKIIVDRRFRGTYCPDDGGSKYLWNVGRQLFYTAVQPRRQFWTWK